MKRILVAFFVIIAFGFSSSSEREDFPTTPLKPQLKDQVESLRVSKVYIFRVSDNQGNVVLREEL